jgi:hypothetical protein
MVLITALLVVLLVAGLFLAARELMGHKAEPEWGDIGKLRERLGEEFPAPPVRQRAGRCATLAYCRQLRKEFRLAWRLCRLLAPIAGDSGYVGRLVVVNLKFQGIFALAVVCSAVGASTLCDRLTQRLRGIGASIRGLALVILTSPELDHGFTPA